MEPIQYRGSLGLAQDYTSARALPGRFTDCLDARRGRGMCLRCPRR